MFSSLLASLLPHLPKSLVGFASRPYIAGETLADGVRVVRDLNSKGMMATMDVLGESITDRQQALAMRAQCEAVLHAIRDEKLDANLSVKPTQLGLSFDPALCEENMRVLCALATDIGSFIRLDMEDHPYTTLTLDMYRRLRADFPGHVGVVIQAYLRRSAEDISSLLEEGATNIRLCKGIYVEPAELAFQERREVRDSYIALLRTLLTRGGYVGIATHDDVLLDAAREMVRSLGLSREEYEFQMLLGVRPAARDALVAQGHRLRVYVPFGDQWYAYSIRRLKENPRMAMHIIKAFFGLSR